MKVKKDPFYFLFLFRACRVRFIDEDFVLGVETVLIYIGVSS